VNINDAKKITIFGWPATGKSTFARQLGQKLNIAVYHLDDIRWDKNRQRITGAEFQKEYEKLFKNKSWIIEGNVFESIDERFKQADLAIIFESNRLKSVSGVFGRWLRVNLYGETRVGGGDDTLMHLSCFIIKKFPTRMVNVKLKLRKYPINVIVIKNRKDMKRILEEER